VSDATRGLLDTSVVVALGEGVELDLPAEVCISVVTLCELHHGVLVSSGKRQAERMAVLAEVEREFAVLPVDARVAPHYGRLLSAARESGGARPAIADALIAATALSHGLLLYTRDRDFERMDVPAAGLRIV
jgi:predicted nucleic acid-binding protein